MFVPEKKRKVKEEGDGEKWPKRLRHKKDGNRERRDVRESALAKMNEAKLRRGQRLQRLAE